MSVAVQHHPSSFSWGRRVIVGHPVAAFLVMVYVVNIAVALSPTYQA